MRVPDCPRGSPIDYQALRKMFLSTLSSLGPGSYVHPCCPPVLLSHRALAAFQRQARTYTHDAVSHNSHALVIRKRASPRTRAVDVKVGRVAMNAARTTPSSRVA